MEFVGTDTVPFRGLLELINMHKQELLKIVDVETLYSLDILQGKPCVIDGNFEFLSFNLNTAQGRHGRFLAGKTATVAATSLACRCCCHQVLFCKSRQDCSLAGLTLAALAQSRRLNVISSSSIFLGIVLFSRPRAS